MIETTEITELEDKFNAVAYQHNMAMYAYCAAMSRKHLAAFQNHKEDIWMFRFWSNAARGYEARAIAIA